LFWYRIFKTLPILYGVKGGKHYVRTGIIRYVHSGTYHMLIDIFQKNQSNKYVQEEELILPAEIFTKINPRIITIIFIKTPPN